MDVARSSRTGTVFSPSTICPLGESSLGRWGEESLVPDYCISTHRLGQDGNVSDKDYSQPDKVVGVSISDGSNTVLVILRD